MLSWLESATVVTGSDSGSSLVGSPLADLRLSVHNAGAGQRLTLGDTGQDTGNHIVLAVCAAYDHRGRPWAREEALSISGTVRDRA